MVPLNTTTVNLKDGVKIFITNRRAYLLHTDWTTSSLQVNIQVNMYIGFMFVVGSNVQIVKSMLVFFYLNHLSYNLSNIFL